MDFTPIYQVECGVCETSPVVGILSPGGVVVCTSLCGPCFFGDRSMLDPNRWNETKEATE